MLKFITITICIFTIEILLMNIKFKDDHKYYEYFKYIAETNYDLSEYTESDIRNGYLTALDNMDINSIKSRKLNKPDFINAVLGEAYVLYMTALKAKTPIIPPCKRYYDWWINKLRCKPPTQTVNILNKLDPTEPSTLEDTSDLHSIKVFSAADSNLHLPDADSNLHMPVTDIFSIYTDRIKAKLDNLENMHLVYGLSPTSLNDFEKHNNIYKSFKPYLKSYNNVKDIEALIHIDDMLRTFIDEYGDFLLNRASSGSNVPVILPQSKSNDAIAMSVFNIKDKNDTGANHARYLIDPNVNNDITLKSTYTCIIDTSRISLSKGMPSNYRVTPATDSNQYYDYLGESYNTVSCLSAPLPTGTFEETISLDYTSDIDKLRIVPYSKECHQSIKVDYVYEDTINAAYLVFENNDSTSCPHLNVSDIVNALLIMLKGARLLEGNDPEQKFDLCLKKISVVPDDFYLLKNVLDHKSAHSVLINYMAMKSVYDSMKIMDSVLQPIPYGYNGDFRQECKTIHTFTERFKKEKCRAFAAELNELIKSMDNMFKNLKVSSRLISNKLGSQP